MILQERFGGSNFEQVKLNHFSGQDQQCFEGMCRRKSDGFLQKNLINLGFVESEIGVGQLCRDYCHIERARCVGMTANVEVQSHIRAKRGRPKENIVAP